MDIHETYLRMLVDLTNDQTKEICTKYNLWPTFLKELNQKLSRLFSGKQIIEIQNSRWLIYAFEDLGKKLVGG